MRLVIPVHEISDSEISHTGGKAYALAVMAQQGLNVPEAIAVTTEAYDTFVTQTGLRTQIMMELNRKTYDDIRWEELWDTSLRVRNMFANTPLPLNLHRTIEDAVHTFFPSTAVVVRSSAPGEDTAETSFAGLHASYVNVKGAGAIVEHIKLVWASLWSDASLLYRKELGLDVGRSSMAVVVQKIIAGDVSGIAFGQNPGDPSQCIIESVYGLNQGLVDGTLEPDRWILDRAEGRIISHTAAERRKALYPSEGGTALAQLQPEQQETPPLTEEDIRKVYALVMKTEEIFGTPQDVEWTIKDNSIYLLQSRPITALADNVKDDKRGWYLSLTKSFENLRTMRHTIEDRLIPELKKETESLAETDLSRLTDQGVRKESEKRRDIFEKWKKIYWEYFIPFAHGMRLFGTVYNDTVHPEDPYEFLSLLSSGKLLSMQRNETLQKMSSLIQSSDNLLYDLKKGDYSNTVFNNLLQQFIASYGDLLCTSPHCNNEVGDIIKIVTEMASADIRHKTEDNQSKVKEKAFLSHFEGKKRKQAEEMLDIGRASYSMRDNDNIYMGKLKARVLEVEEELSRRSGSSNRASVSAGHFDSLSLAVHDTPPVNMSADDSSGFRLQARQITGQPAGPGIASGTAHVIRHASDLLNFKKGEVLVCDAIDPNMTFVVPLACAIVERRGGMLIHGAIIAREYGLPCVTGITRATEIIRSGDRVSVDGYLGIVIIDTAGDPAQGYG